MDRSNRNAFMTLLTFFYKNGLWLSWPVILLGVGLLYFYILTAVRMGATYRLHTLPLVAEQTVDFDQSGVAGLWLEGPLLTSRFAGLAYELTGSDGLPVESRRALSRQRSSSFSRVRLLDHVYTIPRAGRYILRIRGLGPPQATDENHQLVFMRPHLFRTIGCVLGILLGAALTIGGIVNFLLRLSQGP